MATADNYSNFATSTIYGGAAGAGSNFQATDLTLYVNPGEGSKFPNAPFPFTIGADTSTPEALDATAITGDQITVASRAPGAIGYAPGTLIQHGMTAAAATRIWNAINGADHFPITNNHGSSLTITNDGATNEILVIANSAASGLITLQSPGGVNILNGVTVEHSFSNTGNAMHQGTLTVVGASSLDNGVLVTDGAGQITSTLTVNTKHVLLGYISAAPASVQGVVSIRVTGDTQSRASLQIRSDGYGQLAFGPGGSTAPAVLVYGGSGGLNVTATTTALSGALTVGTGATVTSGGLTVTAGGATITAGGLTVTAGATSLDGGKVATDGSGKTTIGGSGGLTNTQQALLVQYGSAPGADLSIFSTRVTPTDTGYRVGLVFRSTGYGAVGLHNGSGATPVALLEGVSGGLSVTATGSSFSGTITAGTGLTVTSGGATITAGGLTVTAGGLTVSAGTTSLDGAKVLTDGAGSLDVTVHALGQVQPREHGLVGWAFDPVMVGNGSTGVSGTVYLSAIYVNRSTNVTKIKWGINAAGASPVTSQNWIGLFNASGTLLQSVNIDARVTTVGAFSETITSTAVTPGLYWVGWVINATTMPAIYRGAGSINAALVNTNLAAATMRFATNGTGTSLANITPASNVSSQLTFWAAIG